MEIANIVKSKYTVKDQTAKQFVYEDVSVWADWGLDGGQHYRCQRNNSIVECVERNGCALNGTEKHLTYHLTYWKWVIIYCQLKFKYGRL